MPFNPRIPYDELPLLPPKQDVETKAVLKQALAATRALAELKGAGGLIPDQAILINAIPLLEAKLSSEIENIVTTQDELFHAEATNPEKADADTREVLRYRTALRLGYDAIASRAISLELIKNICSTILDRPMDFRAGQTDQVFIGNPQTRQPSYTPPRGGRALMSKLRNFESFLAGDNGIDPLIKMAVAHYQFEAIHPFTDGNGRTGRILNILMLVRAGLLEIPVLYLSRFILENKSRYYRLLRGVTEHGEWEPWLVYMLKGVEETARWTTARIRAIRALFDETAGRIKRELPKVYSKELVEIIFRLPYCKIAFLVDAGIAKRQTASEYLRALEGIGVLRGEAAGREIVYRHPALLEVLRH
ncbi:MAG: Fic family protein [bacterium]|jgi:Fic family protein